MNLDERSEALDKRLENNPIDDAISVLTRDAARRRRQVIALTISLVLDILLTIGLAALSVQTSETANNAQRNQNSIVASCKAGNDFRATEAALWEHILAIQPVSTDLTPEQQAQRDKIVADFKTYLKTAFAPRDCDNIVER